MEENELLEEFTIEALELIEDAEMGILKIDKGEEFSEQYNLIFRSFHSLKGASGMMGVDLLQHYVHELETNFSTKKDEAGLSKEMSDYFLQGIDQMREFLIGNIEDLNIKQLKYPGEDASQENENIPDQIAISPDSKLGKVYIIDDEKDIVEIIENFLEDQNLIIERFADTDDLIEAIELADVPPNLIISDFNMPKKNGEQLIDYIHDNVANIPFLFISGFLDKDLVIRLLDKGAIGFLDKPFAQDELIKKVRTALIRSKSQNLIELAIDTLIGNFGELESSMQQSGKKQLLNVLRQEMANILDQRKLLEQIIYNKS